MLYGINVDVLISINIYFQAGKEKGNEDLSAWSGSVRNHFWYCSRECAGNCDDFKVSCIFMIIFKKCIT